MENKTLPSTSPTASSAAARRLISRDTEKLMAECGLMSYEEAVRGAVTHAHKMGMVSARERKEYFDKHYTQEERHDIKMKVFQSANWAKQHVKECQRNYTECLACYWAFNTEASVSEGVAAETTTAASEGFAE
jgi:hypothetical protein